MKKILLATLAFLSIGNVMAQTLILDWAKRMGSTADDNSYGVAVDASGNVYTTGSFGGTVDFNPGTGTFNMTSTGSVDAFVSKLDANGNFVWAIQIGGTSGAAGTAIATDASGNIYLSGYYIGTVDFDPGAGIFNISSVSGSADIFVVKLDPSGALIWAKSMGGSTSSESPSALTIDASGNVYTIGYFQGSGDFNPGSSSFILTSNGNSDIFISKLDVNGNFVWAVNMGGSYVDYGRGIAVDASGNVYTTGYFLSSTVDFDPGAGTFILTSLGMADFFISKLDVNGNFVWAKSIGSTGSDFGYSLALDAVGNVLVAGEFNGTVDFDPGTGTTNLITTVPSGFILKLDSTGNFVWAKAMIGATGVFGYSICSDASNNVYTLGQYFGTADFDPGTGTYNLTAVGDRDVFVSKLDATGNFVWAFSFGGTTFDFGFNITVDAAYNVYTTGYFEGFADFDPTSLTTTLTSAGLKDIFIQKIEQCTPPAQPGAITGNTTVCSGTSNTYSISSVAGATGYTWTVPSGTVINSGQGTTSITVTMGTTSGNISVAANNICSSTPSTVAVTVNVVPPQPGSISGSGIICIGTTGTYSISSVAGATGYTWTVPTGSTINSGQGTTSIDVTIGVNSGNVTVTANNTCGVSIIRTKPITALAIPSQPGTISGNTAVCSGTTNTYSISSVNGATSYTWSVPSGATINSGQGTTSINVTLGVNSGNVTVTAVNSCGSSTIQSSLVSISIPYAFFAWSATNLAVTFTNLSTETTTYSWAFGDAGTSSAPNPVHNYSTSGTYTVELTATGACGSDYYTTNITITDSTSGGDVSVSEIENKLTLAAYPNPTNGKFKITIGDPVIQAHQKYTIEIFNLFGQIVHQLEMENQDSEIDLSSFSNGIYYVKCISETGEGMVKIVKE